MLTPVGFWSTVRKSLDLGDAAPGPERARRDATPPRDTGTGREATLLTGLEAPALDGFSMSYHREQRVA